MFCPSNACGDFMQLWVFYRKLGQADPRSDEPGTIPGEKQMIISRVSAIGVATGNG